MPLSFDNDKAGGQIVSMYQERRKNRLAIFNRMDEIRRHYNGEITVPLPELDEIEKPAVPNLIAQGIDQFATRVASTIPNIAFPSLRPGIQVADNKARDRRLATVGWWDMNQMGTKIRRRARHLTAYGMSVVSISPVSLDPSDRREIPFWRVRNPLATFPAPMIDPDNMEPSDCIFSDQRPLGWLQDNYPRQMSLLYKGEASSSEMFTILEYMDEIETVLVAVGKERKPGQYLDPSHGLASSQVLDRVPNRAEVCPVIIAGRITLDRLQGQFDQMTGMYMRAAKLDALNTIAVFRGVFPDEWVVSPPNSPTSPRVVVEADGKQGVRGILDKGQIQIVHPQQTQDAGLSLDRLERAQRFAGGVPAEFGGESGSNIRTARRGESVMSASVDMPLQEYQEIFANSLETEVQVGIKTMKAYYGSKPSMFFFGKDGKITKPDYTPNETFETDICHVEYPLPGTDASGMVVQVGQLIGTGVMSTETAMEVLPMIKDPIKERDSIEIEGLRKAMLQGLEQQAIQGQLDPATLARIVKAKSQRHMTLEDAVQQVHEEMQQEQSEKAQQMQQQQPGQPVAPQMQPGMGVSPENPIQGAQPQQGPPPLQQLLGQLGQGGQPQGMPQGV